MRPGALVAGSGAVTEDSRGSAPSRRAGRHPVRPSRCGDRRYRAQLGMRKTGGRGVGGAARGPWAPCRAGAVVPAPAALPTSRRGTGTGPAGVDPGAEVEGGVGAVL